MSVVRHRVIRQRKDAVDALEHVLQGVQSDVWSALELPDRVAGRIVTSSENPDGGPDVTRVEEEVTVLVSRLPLRRRRRR